MTARGSWGDWAVIEKPRYRRRSLKISCDACTHFVRGHCTKTGIVDVNESWKECEHFYFKTKYDTARNWNKLVKEKSNKSLHSIRG